jgi:hypothetical protein
MVPSISGIRGSRSVVVGKVQTTTCWIAAVSLRRLINVIHALFELYHFFLFLLGMFMFVLPRHCVCALY